MDRLLSRGTAAPRVAVVGAGYAGMAAAVTLARRGARVTVFESGPVPGGRARRVVTGDHSLDNGQHILVGAYGTLFALMREVGVPAGAVLRIPLELRYADGFALRAFYLPAPLGLAAGLLAARGLPWRERVGAVRFMRTLRRHGFRLEADCSVSELLARHAQDGRIGHYLWRPLCVSALNTPPELASARVFLAVLRDTLGGEAEASDLVLPCVDLSRLFPEPAAAWLRQRHPNAVGEAMEGFAVATAAAHAGLPFAELRAVSNAVGPRDRAAWRIPDALAALERAAAALVSVEL